MFRGNEEAGGLDNISRRYAWLRRILQNYDEEHGQIFPAHWKVNEALCKAFCDTTRYPLVRPPFARIGVGFRGDKVNCREDFRGILARSGKGLDVKLLLNALQQSLEFEHYLEKRFSQHVCTSTSFLSNK